MEKSEPTLVPEWLRSAGSVAGGTNSAHHFASSSSHSDVSSSAHHLRNRTSKSISDFDTPRSAVLDRSSSSNSRRNSSNGSTKHAYSSFNRSHRDKEREKEKERSNYGDPWDRDYSDPLGNIFTSRVEKDTLRRSQSMVSRKQSELFARRAAIDSKSSSNSSHNNDNGVLSGVGVGSQKVVFDKDFPSLGTEERTSGPDIGRVPSPGFSTAVQSLPVGNSALIGGEGWTSALVEVPSAIIASSSSGSFPVQPTVAATSSSGASTAMAGLNMAEALAQAPARARIGPQLSIKTQRLEELAIKQSRQLIPVTPSMPKASVLNSSDKSKPKTAARTGEMNVLVKSGQQQPSQLHHANQSIRVGPVKSDPPKTSHGKFLVLKPVWENGVASSPKDVTSPTNNSSRAANCALAVAPPAASAPLRSPNNTKLSSAERKVAALDLKSGSTLEKRPSLSQVQSRNDFFNRLKEKTSVNSSITIPDSVPIISSPSTEKSGEITGEVFSDPASPHTIENGAEVTGNCDSSEEVQRFSDTGPSAAVYPDEEEARFLRSLGWEENSGDDGGLTEEEINAFYDQHMKSRPSLNLCRGMQPKLSTPSESGAANLGGASSGLSSSDSVSEA